MALLRVDGRGIWCEAGGFHIDPWDAVPKALITHGHSDHARPGSAAYLCSEECGPVLGMRLPGSAIETIPWGEVRTIGDVQVSFHPAGHVLGSAQIRVEHKGEVWVASGDYKLAPDPTCRKFEPIRCHTFITESTFGLPIYRWPEPEFVLQQINSWWRANQEKGRASVIFAYPLGKSQRLLAGLDPSIGPIFSHGAIYKTNSLYRESGVQLPEAIHTGTVEAKYDWSRSLILAPPSAQGSLWMRRFGAVSTGMASGWMRIRGTRRHRSIDRGFVFSDHADWPGLQDVIAATEAECVLVTHGYRAPMVRWLTESGRKAQALETRFEGEGTEAEDPE